MSAVRTEAAVGAAVVAVAIGFLVYAIQFTDFRSDSAGYRLTASFRSIEGVSVGTHAEVNALYGKVRVTNTSMRI